MQDIKNIIVCADDFGLSPGVNRGILEAAKAKRISAVSCMSAAPFWSDGAKSLSGIDETTTALGLHICLTNLPSLSKKGFLAMDGKMPTFAKLVRLAHKRWLPVEVIEIEIQAQINEFIQHTGKSPDFLDGHMHVHQFPIIRDIVIKVAQEHGAWVRNTYETSSVILKRGVCRAKAFVLSRPGKKMKTCLLKAGIKTNNGFSGIYNFNPDSDYAKLAEKFLRQAQNGMVFMVHPGHADQELAKLDPNTQTRTTELDYLLSGRFKSLLDENNIKLILRP